MTRFLRPAGEHRHEPPPIKGSRFIAAVAPVADAAEAAAFVERLRAEFSDARHVCFAWRLGARGDATRSSDDGEPGGSAGRPILAQLEGHGVSDTVAVVVRYFGGVKLGVGGLMRAYGGAAGQCLDRADLEEVEVTRRVVVEHPYDCSGAVSGLLVAEGLTAEDAEYGATVRFALRLPEGHVGRIVHELTERTAGRATVRV